MNEPELKLLGKHIREKRKSLGWTQEVLAHESKIDRSYIGGVERGQRNVTFIVLCRICTALGCEVGDIASDIPGSLK